MITKTAERRRDGRQSYSYRDLVTYIAGGGQEEKTLYTNHRNLTPISESTEEIIKEMETCGDLNLRAKNKIHHGILSWREGEVPTKEQVEEAVSIYLQEMGMENCQCYYGLHKNTDNLHLHICVNKIDPATHKSVQPAQGYDYKANERISRRIELAQGWEVLERGEHYEVVDGQIYEKDTKKAVPNLSGKAADYENLTSAKSAERIAQERCATVLFNAESWQKVHEGLAEVGCRMEKKGSGAVLFVGEVAVKLSKVSQKLSLKKMEKRLGAFEEPKEKLEVKTIEAEPLKQSASSEEYLKERKEYYCDKLTAQKKLSRRFNVEFAEMKERHALERKELFESRTDWGGQGALLNALRSELAWKQLQERKEWTERKKVRRRLINESFHKAFPSYKEWLKARGKKREAEFWRYRESLPGILLGESENFEKPLHAQQQYRTEIIEWGRNEKGYKRRGYVYRESKTDAMSFVDTGRRIDVIAWQDEKTLRDALELAQQKWGGATVNGSREYVNRCIDIAARYGIKISNPELQEQIKERKEELARERQANEKIESKADTKQERGERMNKVEEGLEAYDRAVKADRYRITAFYTGSDGKPRAFVFDKDKSSSAPSLGYTYEELKKEIWKIEREDRRSKNIYVTPISEKTHHILVDDLSREALKKMVDAGYRPAVIVESSTGNYQAIINVLKLDAKSDKELSNLLMKKLNNEYGDKNIQGAVHPHRVAGTHNHKPSRKLPDGSQPEVKLIYSAKEKGYCRKAHMDAAAILKELQKMDRERKARLMRSAPRREEGKNVTAYEAYMSHARDIMAYRSGANSNLSVVDSMVAVRMYVTGWSVSEIASAIEAGAKEIRGEAGRYKHNWPDYARRTAHYPETMRGSREVAANRNKARAWLLVEGRGGDKGIER